MNRKQEQTTNRWSILGRTAVLVAALVALNMGQVMSQTGGSKDTKKLKSKVEEAHKSVAEAENQVKETMTLYNSLFEEEADKPESTYKKLSKAVEDCDKVAKDARKSVDSMREDLTKFFGTWEEEIEKYSSDAMKQQSQDRLAAVKGKFDRFNTALNEASELYAPFIASLRDQVLFLGRDLSPEALSALQGEATKLNEDVAKLYVKVDEALNDTRAEEVEAASPTGEMEEEAPTDEAEASGGMD
jgi:signal transduction protein with GAF and PtsI domain